MIKYIFLTLVFLAAASRAAAQQPLYLVNGAERAEINSIPPGDIEHVEMLPADDQTIARYGEKASHGVMLITLRYDREAAFTADSTFTGYIARQIKWDDDEPAARVVVRYTVTPEGVALATKTLECTDNRLKRRVLKAIEEAPRWSPAHKDGAPVATEGVLRIQLPEGKVLLRPVELVIR